MNIANGTQFVRVVRRAVIDDRKVELRLFRAVIIGPFLKLVRKFCVGDNANPINAADGREIIEHVINHRLACDRQERLWPSESKRIQPSSVTGGENNYLHLSSNILGAICRANSWQ